VQIDENTLVEDLVEILVFYAIGLLIFNDLQTG
jgi:hypothetical protein